MQIAKWLPAVVAALTLSFGTDVFAGAKGNKSNKGYKVKTVPPGQVQRQKSGAKPIPPGQIKRYTRGSRLPDDLRYESLSDLSKWKLKPLKSGEEYVRIDQDVFRIEKNTRTVIDAVGIVDDLLK